MIIHPTIRYGLLAGALTFTLGLSACSNTATSTSTAHPNNPVTTDAAHSAGGNPSTIGPAAGPAGSH